MINPGEDPDALYTVVRASLWRIFLVESVQGLVWGFVVSVVISWAIGEPKLIVMALGGWVVGGIWYLMRKSRSALELAEDLFCGPASPGPGRERIRLSDIDRRAGYRPGRLAGLFGRRRILSLSGREIAFNRLWYDPSEVDRLMSRIGVDG